MLVTAAFSSTRVLQWTGDRALEVDSGTKRISDDMCMWQETDHQLNHAPSMSWPMHSCKRGRSIAHWELELDSGTRLVP